MKVQKGLTSFSSANRRSTLRAAGSDEQCFLLVTKFYILTRCTRRKEKGATSACRRWLLPNS